MTAMTTVYVHPHDDEDVKYVINDEDDQDATFRDYLNNEQETYIVGGISFLPADVLSALDPIAYSEAFSNWSDNDWTVMQMPTDVWLSEHEVNVAWVEANIG